MNKDLKLISELYVNMYNDEVLEEGIKDKLMAGLFGILALTSSLQGGQQDPRIEAAKNEVTRTIQASSNVQEIKNYAKTIAQSTKQALLKIQADNQKELDNFARKGLSGGSVKGEMLQANQDAAQNIQKMDNLLKTIDSITDPGQLATLLYDAGIHADHIQKHQQLNKLGSGLKGLGSDVRSMDAR